MSDWKNNLLKLIAGAALFCGWAALVKFIDPKDAPVLVLAIQSALTGIGIIHLRAGDKSDIINNIIKLVAAGGLMGLMGFLVFQNLASSEMLLADIGAALVSLGIIGASSVPSLASKPVEVPAPEKQPEQTQNQ